MRLAEAQVSAFSRWRQDRWGVVFGNFPDPMAPVAEEELTKVVPKGTVTGFLLQEGPLETKTDSC